MFRLTIDGQVIPPQEYDSLDNSEVVLRRIDGKTGRIATSFADNLKLSGNAAQIIYNQIINNPIDGRFKKIPVEIFDTECNTDIFIGHITYETLEWCYQKCTVTCSVIERGFEADAINCLKSNFIFDNTFGFQQQYHHFIRHCTEMRPAALFQAFMYIGFVIHVNMYLFYPTILLISAIIVLANIISNATGFGDAINDPGNDGILDVWQDLIQKWDRYITGCGNGHPAPLVQDYLKNACQKCGLTFQSTIFSTFITASTKWKTVGLNVDEVNPYATLAQLDAPVNKGQFDYTTWIDENKPNMISEQYLEFVKSVFNADYRVNGTVLTFERKDAFLNPAILIDVSKPELHQEQNISLCMSYDHTDRPAWGRFEFQPDGVDWVGNEAKWRFNDIIPFNTTLGTFPLVKNPLYSTFKGEKVVSISASPQRYRRDGITEDVLSEWQSFFSAIGLADILVDDGDDYNILLPVELTFSPKLICLEYGTFRENAKAVHFYDAGRGHYFFNKDMTFGADGNLHDSDVSEKVFISGNLYDRFWYINDPRINLKQGKKFKLEAARCCEFLIEFVYPNSGFEKSVLLPGGFLGAIEEVTVKSDRFVITGSY